MPRNGVVWCSEASNQIGRYVTAFGPLAKKDEWEWTARDWEDFAALVDAQSLLTALAQLVQAENLVLAKAGKESWKEI